MDRLPRRRDGAQGESLKEKKQSKQPAPLNDSSTSAGRPHALGLWTLPPYNFVPWCITDFSPEMHVWEMFLGIYVSNFVSSESVSYWYSLLLLRDSHWKLLHLFSSVFSGGGSRHSSSKGSWNYQELIP